MKNAAGTVSDPLGNSVADTKALTKTPETRVIHGDSAGERSFPHHAMLYIMNERIQVTL